MRRLLSLSPIAALALGSGCAGPEPRGLVLHLRSREPAAGSTGGEWKTLEKQEAWDPKRTALVVCDMWDDHWCRGAARRVTELAGPVNEAVKAARSRGMLIIHAPSTTVNFYQGTPQRRLAREAPFSSTPVALATAQRWGTAWCWPDGPGRTGAPEPELPIDDSDMGCDCAEKCPIRTPWTRQIASIEIAPGDAIADDGQETWNLLSARGIRNVLILGVHTNMCILGRPFAIRQLVRLGVEVALVRDLTDTMYNSRMRPFVDHFTGTDLVVEHIERHWCPTITSADLTGGKPFRFREDRR